MNSIRFTLRRWADFHGRSCRSEFWLWFAFHAAVLLGLQLAGAITGLAVFGWLMTAFQLVVLLPALAVGVRRMHDTGRSGWWVLLCLLPVVGGLLFLFMAAQRGEEWFNPFGPALQA